jgi:hypothetical protein
MWAPPRNRPLRTVSLNINLIIYSNAVAVQNKSKRAPTVIAPASWKILVIPYRVV